MFSDTDLWLTLAIVKYSLFLILALLAIFGTSKVGGGSPFSLLRVSGCKFLFHLYLPHSRKYLRGRDFGVGRRRKGGRKRNGGDEISAPGFWVGVWAGVRAALMDG